MPKGYWIARVDARDANAYKAYVDAAVPAFRQYGARFLVRGGQFFAAEGRSRTRNVVIEFPSYQSALDCYNSAVYQAARAHRVPVSDAEIVIVEGAD